MPIMPRENVKRDLRRAISGLTRAQTHLEKAKTRPVDLDPMFEEAVRVTLAHLTGLIGLLEDTVVVISPRKDYWIARESLALKFEDVMGLRVPA